VSLEKLLDKDVSKERITKEQAAEVRGRLHPTTKMDDLKDVDFVIEAVPVYLPISYPHFSISSNSSSGNSRAEVQNIFRPSKGLPIAYHPCDEHIVHINHSDSRCNY
jgi:hypothetical protein